MAGRATIVLDVGKTLSKLSLWTAEGRLLERRTRAELEELLEERLAYLRARRGEHKIGA